MRHDDSDKSRADINVAVILHVLGFARVVD